ncbi:hypothetical protein QUB70_12055 [Microcoleus sp. A003_D6]
MPIPQNFFLVEWASCPFQNLIKRIFARGLLYQILSEEIFLFLLILITHDRNVSFSLVEVCCYLSALSA